MRIRHAANAPAPGVSPWVWAAVAGGAGVVGVGALGFVLFGARRTDGVERGAGG